MAKQLEFHEEGRRKLQAGVNKLANAVRATLGPRGRNVVIDKKYGAPTITKDGVTVAKEIELEDPLKTWAHRWPKKWPQKPMTLPATERRQLPFLLRLS